jgi:ribonuclease P/MRP protein subunit POP3
VGLNSTTRQLERQQSHAVPVPTAVPLNDVDDGSRRMLKAVILTHPFNSLQYAHLPLLAALSDPTVLLVPLHSGAEQALCAALALPRVGLVGIYADAPGCEALWESMQDVEAVAVPFLKEVSSGQWMGTKIELGDGRTV